MSQYRSLTSSHPDRMHSIGLIAPRLNSADAS